MEILDLQQLENINGGNMSDTVASAALAAGSVAMTVIVPNPVSAVVAAGAICNFLDHI